MRAQATGAGRTIALSRHKIKREHPCQFAAVLTDVLLLPSLVFSKINPTVCTAIPRFLTTRGATAVLQQYAAGSDAGRCRQPCTNKKHTMRETLQAPGLPDNTGDWPCVTI
ncbi:hypothetical protein TcCL_Unassigned01674 [Trypanosoma cruzi]|nr:hypothetical protein TcCL_Unassigned01674 [Trypanosoma cruzi]